MLRGAFSGGFGFQAADIGMGTCIIGWFDEPAVKKLLGIPKKKRAELLIAVGYPGKSELRTKIRKSKEQICSYNTY